MKREDQLALKKAEYEGKVYPSNRFGDVKILEYKNNKQVVIMFLNTGFITEESMGVVRSGHIRDSSLPTNRLWNNMINRCYNEKELSRNPTYKDCHVSEDWRYLSNFKEWCNNQIGFGNQGWHLDKDILVEDSKMYSPETCCFVPPEINNLFTKADRIRGKYPVGVYHDTSKIHKRFSARVSKNGKYKRFGSYLTPEKAFAVYKREKEKYIKEVANKWKDKIDPRVYEALMNWTIEITD